MLRAQTMSLRNRDFVEASRIIGEKRSRIMFSEIAPNLLPILASSLLFTILYSIGAYVTLAYIGLTSTSVWNWGTMLFWAPGEQRATLERVVLVRAAGHLHRAGRHGSRAAELRHRRVHQSATSRGGLSGRQRRRLGLPRRLRLGLTPVLRARDVARRHAATIESVAS